MAIYSLSHSTVGRSTHEKFTAAAHINYITRTTAVSEALAEHMPEDRHKACLWIKEQELSDRKNARVIDKIMMALPIELNHHQQTALVRDFCQEVTEGRTAYFAVIHSQGKDAHNPHAHVVIRDRDIKTGKRVIQMSERGSTEKVREIWQHRQNAHLAMHGFKVRVDRRTLREQGIERDAQIHIGPNANAIGKKQGQPESKDRNQAMSCVRDEKGGQGGKKTHKVEYASQIDKGMTRLQFNEHIIDLNLEKMKRSKDYGTRQMAEFEAEQRVKDRKLNLRRDAIRREHKQAASELWENYRTTREELKRRQKEAKAKSVQELKTAFKPLWEDHYKRKERDLTEFKKNDNQVIGRFRNLKRALGHIWSQSGSTQDKARGKMAQMFNSVVDKEERLKALTAQHEAEHQKLYKKYREEKNRLHRALNGEYGPTLSKLKNEWEADKQTLRAETGKAWQEFGQQEKERRREKDSQRQNLEQSISQSLGKQPSSPLPDKAQEQDNSKSRLDQMWDKMEDQEKNPDRKHGGRERDLGYG